jgi:hypothetical protein
MGVLSRNWLKSSELGFAIYARALCRPARQPRLAHDARRRAQESYSRRFASVLRARRWDPSAFADVSSNSFGPAQPPAVANARSASLISFHAFSRLLCRDAPATPLSGRLRLGQAVWRRRSALGPTFRQDAIAASQSASGVTNVPPIKALGFAELRSGQ